MIRSSPRSTERSSAADLDLIAWLIAWTIRLDTFPSWRPYLTRNCDMVNAGACNQAPNTRVGTLLQQRALRTTLR
jgi:hypothetical protein